MEFTIVGWDDTVEIHIVFGKSASLIETCELDDATSDDLILWNAEDLLFVESLQCIDDSEGHADRKCGWHCDKNNIDKFDDDVRSGLIVDVDDDDADIGYDGDEEEEEKELCALPLEAVLLLLGEQDDTNKLSLCCDEICTNNTNRNAVSLAVWLKFLHFFLVAHLHDSCPFEHKCILIYFSWIWSQFLKLISLFYHWNWFSSKGAFID